MLNSIDSPSGLALGQDVAGARVDVLPVALAELRVWDRVRGRYQIVEQMHRRLVGTEVGLRGLWPLSAVEAPPPANAPEVAGGWGRDFGQDANHCLLIGGAEASATAPPMVPRASHTHKLMLHLPLDNANGIEVCDVGRAGGQGGA